MNCIKLTNNLIIYVNTKHIELQYHYICNRIQDGSVEVDFILIHKTGYIDPECQFLSTRRVIDTTNTWTWKCCYDAGTSVKYSMRYGVDLRGGSENGRRQSSSMAISHTRSNDRQVWS
uniref:Uncharacterized protein n=2 Tax=Physcomitrium patens TaxID=3218 RepID=A0A2K1L032_PHYPA|nr:hypothetical protein PHYPA_002180 [Physcomitrium patens]